MNMSEMLFAAVAIGAGLIFLVAGGELLVRGASALAALLRISPLVIGLTVVAFGTSAPELAVSVQAAYAGSGDLAVGNLVGSNIANVLHQCSRVGRPRRSHNRIEQTGPVRRAGGDRRLLAPAPVWTGRRRSTCRRASCCSVSLGAYNIWSIRQGRAESEMVQAGFPEDALAADRIPRTILVNVALVVLGLVLLGLGARWLVDGAVGVARLMGIQELVIGLTVVAIGTSMPELVTTILASLRGQRIWR